MSNALRQEQRYFDYERSVGCKCADTQGAGSSLAIVAETLNLIKEFQVTGWGIKDQILNLQGKINAKINKVIKGTSW